jgi:chemotaxis protein MotA
MFVIIGIVVVIGAILGGYLMEHGNIKVLIQPAELIIIGGAAIATILIANPCIFSKKLLAASPAPSKVRLTARPSIWSP